MAEQPKPPLPPGSDPAEERLLEAATKQEQRKLEARQKQQGLWFGLGLWGVVGWSVAVPVLLGIALGRWLDLHYPSRFSWTLTLLLAGVMLGALNVWYWLGREHEE